VKCCEGVQRAARTENVTSVDFATTSTKSCVTHAPGGLATRYRSAGSARRPG